MRNAFQLGKVACVIAYVLVFLNFLTGKNEVTIWAMGYHMRCPTYHKSGLLPLTAGTGQVRPAADFIAVPSCFWSQSPLNTRFKVAYRMLFALLNGAPVPRHLIRYSRKVGTPTSRPRTQLAPFKMVNSRILLPSWIVNPRNWCRWIVKIVQVSRRGVTFHQNLLVCDVFELADSPVTLRTLVRIKMKVFEGTKAVKE